MGLFAYFLGKQGIKGATFLPETFTSLILEKAVYYYRKSATEKPHRFRKMMKYHGPAERLRAAQSTDTPPDELSLLSQSEFTFVRVAVAANPSTPQSTLHSLIPAKLQSQDDFEIALGLMRNPMLQAEDCAKIGSLIRESIGKITLRDYYPAQLIDAFIFNPNVPLESVIALTDPTAIPKHIRHYIAVPGVRPEVLNKLLDDPSLKVKSRAGRALKHGKQR